jgi:tRNA G18 (ribose-2'-O)-methylase SpoU
VAAAASRLAILEGINDHENLGAIFRSAAALGVEGILLAPTVPDPLYRRSVRVSMGAVLMVPYARVESWPGNLHGLKATGFTVVALTPDPSADLIESIVFPTRIALLLGSESEGLTKEALAAADLRVRIGQSGAMDSLNVGHAAAIAFHHFGRGPG